MKHQQKYGINSAENQARARFERSLAFHVGLRAVGNSVKYLFSQPERFFTASDKKMRRIKGHGSDAIIVKKECYQ